MHVLPYVYQANQSEIVNHLADLLCQLPDCELDEKIALFRLCSIIACHEPKVMLIYQLAQWLVQLLFISLLSANCGQLCLKLL